MNPSSVFSASLITSLVLWLPSMVACLRGDLDLSVAGLRFLVALALTRVALGGLARLVNAYRTASPRPGRQPDPGTSDPPRRRREDHEPADLPI